MLPGLVIPIQRIALTRFFRMIVEIPRVYSRFYGKLFLSNISHERRGISMLPAGVSVAVSRPTRYTMTYLNGPRTYTEPFAMITCSREYVATVGTAVSSVIGSLNAIPVVGQALSAIAGFGAAWYGHASLNPDGSITLLFAQHYAGTKAGGIDVTAWPLPGVDPNVWGHAVQGLMAAIQGARGFADAAPALMDEADGPLAEPVEATVDGEAR
jgi:hypothetical protein